MSVTMQPGLNNTMVGAQLGAGVGVASGAPLNGGAAGMMPAATSSTAAGGAGGAPVKPHDSIGGLSQSIANMSMNPAGASSSGVGSGRRDPGAANRGSGGSTGASAVPQAAGAQAASPAAAAAARPNGSASASGRSSAMAKRPEDVKPVAGAAGAGAAAKVQDDALSRQMNMLGLSTAPPALSPFSKEGDPNAVKKTNVSQVAPSQPPPSTNNSTLGAPAPGGSTTNTPHNSVIQPTSSIAANTQPQKKKEKQSISYAAERVIGNGSFGVVYQATVIETGETVAIKKVLQDRRFKNRELQIMGMLDHPDVVALKHCFYSKGEKPDDVFLNLVMEYIPETIHRTLRNHTKAKKLVPIMYTKVYMYQVSRALAYIHSCGICHRDIKPQNLLLNTKSHDVKLCDFGSAKILIRGEPNVAYICSRYYRAPELVFEATEYTCAIDIWSLGCVMAELLLGKPLFPGDSGVDQLIEIIKILGTPTKEQIQAMNPNHQSFKFPQIKPHPWSKVFRNKAPPDAIDLVSKFLHYEPHLRLDPFEALSHPFFDELREPNARLPNGKPLPNLFNFTESEFKRMEVVGLTKKLVPPHVIKGLREKYKNIVLPTTMPINPYASPYPHIIAQMAALAQQQAAQQQQLAAAGAAQGAAGAGAGVAPMMVAGGAAVAPQQFAAAPQPMQGAGYAAANAQPPVQNKPTA